MCPKIVHQLRSRQMSLYIRTICDQTEVYYRNCHDWAKKERILQNAGLRSSSTLYVNTVTFRQDWPRDTWMLELRYADSSAALYATLRAKFFDTCRWSLSVARSAIGDLITDIATLEWHLKMHNFRSPSSTRLPRGAPNNNCIKP